MFCFLRAASSDSESLLPARTRAFSMLSDSDPLQPGRPSFRVRSRFGRAFSMVFDEPTPRIAHEKKGTCHLFVAIGCLNRCVSCLPSAEGVQ